MPLKQTTFKQTTIPVAGMSCGSCARRIKTALQAQRGIDAADVKLAPGEVAVSYNPETIQPAAIAEAIRKSGYRPGPPE
jgi:copper chaperone CopZ